MSLQRAIANNLAAAFLAGPWAREALVERAGVACGYPGRRLARLVRRLLAAFPEPPPAAALPKLGEWVTGQRAFRDFYAHCRRCQFSPLRQVFWLTPAMTPAPGVPSSWEVPALSTPAALAEWLGLALPELDWFADRPGLEWTLPEGPLRHYTYRWLAKRSGGHRLLEMPKARLKMLQRRILHQILDAMPPHAAAHAYRRGRSVATYVGPHAAQGIVVRLDLRDFFPSTRAARVHALFRTAGYPEAVAGLLTALCTNVVPWDVWRSAPPANAPRSAESRLLFQRPHLPQGTPTSPALANLCAYRLDCRLGGLAKAVGARYTRYADDLAFSGGRELCRSVRRFQVAVCRIALEEGYEVHTRKSRFMRQGVRQQLVGVVLNAHPNLARREYDRLKAILYNCARHGPQSQNRDGLPDWRAHLAGQIAYVGMLNPDRAQRLRALFDRIAWPAEG
jgi:hypothetical protein